MNQDRIGMVLMFLAAAWTVMLVITEPGSGASNYFRILIGITAVAMIVVAFLPRHLFLTGTVLAFTTLGLALHIGLFGIFGIGVKGLLPAAIFAIAMWFIRNRLDGSAVVVITAVVACSLAMIQPQVVMFAFTFIAIANILLWIANRVASLRVGR